MTFCFVRDVRHLVSLAFSRSIPFSSCLFILAQTLVALSCSSFCVVFTLLYFHFLSLSSHTPCRNNGFISQCIGSVLSLVMTPGLSMCMYDLYDIPEEKGLYIVD